MFAIIEKLGGWSSAQSLLEKRGIVVADQTYRKWRSREGLPQNVRLALELEAVSRGVPYDQRDFNFTKQSAAA